MKEESRVCCLKSSGWAKSEQNQCFPPLSLSLFNFFLINSPLYQQLSHSVPAAHTFDNRANVSVGNHREILLFVLCKHMYAVLKA